MTIFKRVFLFIAINALVLITISMLTSALGIRPYLGQIGIDYESLLVFCLAWGFGGAFISLAISRMMAKWMMGVQMISPGSRAPHLREIYQMVETYSKKAGLPVTPEVGIYESPEMNAFATGPTRRHALVAVSTGLIEKMDSRSISGVIAHEVAHIANGDMVTMTLLQGVVNAFVMFLARVVAQIISGSISRNNHSSSGIASTGIYFVIVIVLEMVFMILGSIIVAGFSRFREFRADAGGASLAGKTAMISALTSLKREYLKVVGTEKRSGVQFLMISGKSNLLFRLFATHPPLEKRIQKLTQGY